MIAYSNHGYGLAGYLVEMASGVPYAQYIEEKILAPLGMTRSTARIPLPAQLAPDLAVGYGYDFRRDRLEPQPLGYRNLPPAGSVSATGSDMVRFLVDQLRRGGERHRRQFTHHPRLPGFAYGLYESDRNGRRALEHAGDYGGFSALVYLLPDQNLGLFLAANALSGGFREAVLRAFLDRYYPAAAPAPPIPRRVSAAARLFAGSYHPNRYSRRSVEKIAIWDGTYQLEAADEGRLALRPARGPSSRWVEAEPLLFQREDGQGYLALREEQGARYLFFSSPGGGWPLALEKLSWLDDVYWQRPILLSMMGVFFSSLTIWPLAALLRGRRRPGLPALAAAVDALAGFAFMLGVDTWIGNSGYRLRLVYGMTPEMVALLWLPILMVPLTLLLVLFAARAWRRRQWSFAGRLYYSLTSITAVAFLAFLLQWNLLGFRY